MPVLSCFLSFSSALTGCHAVLAVSVQTRHSTRSAVPTVWSSDLLATPAASQWKQISTTKHWYEQENPVKLLF